MRRLWVRTPPAPQQVNKCETLGSSVGRAGSFYLSGRRFEPVPGDMYKSIHFPHIGGGVSIQSLLRYRDNPNYHAPYWTPTVKRGRTRELEIRIPFGKYAVTIYGPGKRYIELVDAPKYLHQKKIVDWIIDEFDSSFNDLAIASLRYHLDYSICDNEPRREKYEDLITRLSEPHPEVCDNDEEHAILDATTEHWFTGGPQKKSPEADAIFDRYHQREADWDARIKQARHDLIDIMRELWS